MEVQKWMSVVYVVVMNHLERIAIMMPMVKPLLMVVMIVLEVIQVMRHVLLIVMT